MVATRTRQKLLDSVTEVLREEGLEGFSLRKVAARAGVSHAAPGALFGSGRSMLTAYATEGFERFAAAMDAAERAEADPRAALEAVGRAYVRFAVNEPLCFSVMFRVELLDGSDPRYLEASRGAYGPLGRAIERCRAAGLILEAADADDIAIAAWSLTHGAAMLWLSRHLAGRIVDPEALARRITRIFTRVLDLEPSRPSSTTGPPVP